MLIGTRNAAAAGSRSKEEEMYKELFFGLVQKNDPNLVSIESDEVFRVGPGVFSQWAPNYGAAAYLVSVSFPNCTRICQNAFSACLGLTTVNLPKVTICDSGAFSSCESLRSLSLPLLTAINGRLMLNCFQMRLLEIPSVTNFDSDGYWLQNIGARRADSDTDDYGNVYKALVDVRANACAAVMGHKNFPWMAPATTKFQCSDGYIVYDGSTSSWKSVPEAGAERRPPGPYSQFRREPFLKEAA